MGRQGQRTADARQVSETPLSHVIGQSPSTQILLRRITTGDIALLALGEQNLQSALAAFDKALALNPNHTGALADKSLALILMLRLFDEGMRLASRLLQIDTRSVKGWQALAWGHFAKSEYPLALSAIDRALHSRP